MDAGWMPGDSADQKSKSSMFSRIFRPWKWNSNKKEGKEKDSLKKRKQGPGSSDIRIQAASMFPLLLSLNCFYKEKLSGKILFIQQDVFLCR